MLDRVNRMVLEQKVPVLGVCVGMQIMGSDSDEGKSAGLGWIEGNVRRMSIKELQSKPYLPHMGWNSISPGHSHPILDGIDFEKGFYFLHSYCFICSDSENVLTTTRYGADFASSIHRDNIFGFQFHPEKSHHNGVRLFSNFASL